MNMTAENWEHWEKVLQTVKVENAKGENSELRSTARVGFRARLAIIPLIDGKKGRPVLVWTRDISINGFGFLHTDAMPKGFTFLVELQRAEGNGPPLWLKCTVRNCREISGDLFCIGALIKKLKPSQPAKPTSAGAEPVAVGAAAAQSSPVPGQPADELQDRIRKAMLE